MPTKSEYVILRMIPEKPGMIVAKNGLENVKEAKALAQDLAMENPEVVFVPAVLYDVAYAKEIRNTQITEPPEQVMNLLGFVEAPGGAAESGDGSGNPDDDPGSEDESDEKPEASDTESGGGDAEPAADAAPAANAAQSSGELF